MVHVSFTFISANSFELLGLKAEEIMKDPTALDNIIIPEDREGFNESTRGNRNRTELWSGGQGTCSRWGSMDRSSLKLWKERFKYCSQGNNSRHYRPQAPWAGKRNPISALVEHLPLGVGVHVNGKFVLPINTLIRYPKERAMSW